MFLLLITRVVLFPIRKPRGKHIFFSVEVQAI